MRYFALLSVSVLSLAIASEAQAFDSFKFLASSAAMQPSNFHLAASEDPLQIRAEKFIDEMANEAIGFLGNGALSDSQKTSRFKRLLKSKYDMPTIGRFALGRYWRVATDAEKKEYQKLFEKMVVDVYSRRFGEYEGQTLEVRSSRKDSERDVTVQSFIAADSGPEIQVDWRVRKKAGRYRVIDVVVAGVSMALTQRSEFASVIQRGGGDVAVLIDHLNGGDSEE